jgi:hypothetical protein
VDDLAKWTSVACSGLGVEVADSDRRAVERLARLVRCRVAAPAVPMTLYLLGVAVGRGLPLAEAVERLGVLSEPWRGIDWRD